MKILVFGQLTDILKTDTLEVNEMADTAALQQFLHQQFPGLAQARYVLSVNKKIVHANTPLSANAELALLPPFSGG